jgi:cysteine-rich repeat protein
MVGSLLCQAACGDDDSGQNVNQNNQSSAICGNGVPEIGEQCDEGAANSDLEVDACRTDCRTAYCGDSVIDSGEACDGDNLAGETCVGRGFTAGQLRCSSTCQLDESPCTTCGNGTAEGTSGQDGYEECDGPDLRGATCNSLGKAEGSLQCGASCTYDISRCSGVLCGNAVLDAGEACDDGNQLSGDGCSGDCRSDESCGNGYLDAVTGEVCDEGPLNSDAPDADCRTDCRSRGCGDGVIDIAHGETCDAGAANSDAPDASCRLNCSPRRCGDGIVDPAAGETCDAGAANSDAPDASCRLDCSPRRCGDGIVDAGETCDAGAANSDAPDASCRLDCSPRRCGDGVVDAGEACDDGPLNSDEPDSPYCRTWCQPSGCGDGILDAGEACDDGPLNSDEPDSPYCRTWCQPSGCGDGILDDDEACDGAILNGITCADLGFGSLSYAGGVLGCDGTCSFDTTRCYSAVSVAPGQTHTCALSSTGEVQCWGGNGVGQLGTGTIGGYRSQGIVIPGLSGVTQLVSGERHSCALLEDGTVRCWGSNDNGRLGDGTLYARPSPVAVSGLSNVRTIAAGTMNTCAIGNDDTLRCWGRGGWGANGDGSYTDRTTPVTVATTTGLTGAIAVAVGNHHACAVSTDGTVWCWGENNGALGNNSTTISNLPVQAIGVTGAVSVAAGSGHSCAVSGTTSTLFCWGYNASGQLGDGITSSTVIPGEIPNFPNIEWVVASAYHTCALQLHSVYCWGENDSGQIGDGTQVDRTTPFRTLDLIGPGRLAVGASSTCAIHYSGAPVWCWGGNGTFQLGDGTTALRTTPVVVTAWDNW